MITIITWVLPLCYCAADLRLCFCILIIWFSHDVAHMTRAIRKPGFFIRENRVTDQLVQLIRDQDRQLIRELILLRR